ncbi:hypothetical protein LPC10_17745 [Methylorubrum sp. B1-46]|uniref:hypothetical protein n=1 Tax=Methylorubrum TaxID=2282523 RepID=UPI001E2E4FE5|nr:MULTISPECIES: hypothetical protein [Methylorubrum]MCG5246864.1 hypothetical protein [Methylorubrum extorquens]UGB24774.1 hypothetical protein LPC10_17745 [Methylorubrum sp. B1-46]
MNRILASAAIAACLAGCQTTARPTVQASMLACQEAPTWRRGGTQRDVAGYVTDLRDAHADCRGKLGAVHGLVGGRP